MTEKMEEDIRILQYLAMGTLLFLLIITAVVFTRINKIERVIGLSPEAPIFVENPTCKTDTILTNISVDDCEGNVRTYIEYIIIKNWVDIIGLTSATACEFEGLKVWCNEGKLSWKYADDNSGYTSLWCEKNITSCSGEAENPTEPSISFFARDFNEDDYWYILGLNMTDCKIYNFTFTSTVVYFPKDFGFLSYDLTELEKKREKCIETINVGLSVCREIMDCRFNICNPPGISEACCPNTTLFCGVK